MKARVIAYYLPKKKTSNKKEIKKSESTNKTENK